MLVCPIPSPPALALAPPWDLPGQWAFCLGAALLLYIVLRHAYANAARPFMRRTRLGFVLAVTGAVVAMGGLGFWWLVQLPYVDRVLAWYGAQPTMLDGHPCTLDALASHVNGLLDAVYVGWGRIATLVCLGGLLVMVVGGGLVRPALHRPQVEPSDA